jgi:hypothetical protein
VKPAKSAEKRIETLDACIRQCGESVEWVAGSLGITASGLRARRKRWRYGMLFYFARMNGETEVWTTPLAEVRLKQLRAELERHDTLDTQS